MNARRCIGSSWSCDVDHSTPAHRQCHRRGLQSLERLAAVHVAVANSVTPTEPPSHRRIHGMATAAFGLVKLEIFTRPTLAVMKGIEWANRATVSETVRGTGRECPGNATSHHRNPRQRRFRPRSDSEDQSQAPTRSTASQMEHQTCPMAHRCRRRTATV